MAKLLWNFDVVAAYIVNKTGIDEDIVRAVLYSEDDYMKENGFYEEITEQES